MILRETIKSEQLGEERELFIYLPPGYDENNVERLYPCLYMHDGQNIFAQAGDSEFGKWEVDITADDLIEKGEIIPLIIVGISNSPDRDYEYTPTYDQEEETGGFADTYLNFLTQELMPTINETYNVSPYPTDTAICGSSLGGLLSLYAIMRHEDLFKKAAILSPSIWWDNKVILDAVSLWEPDCTELKLWVDMGWFEEEELTDEPGHPIDDSRELTELLESRGFTVGENLVYYEDPEGAHNEFSWAKRMQMILYYLFPAAESTEEENTEEVIPENYQDADFQEEEQFQTQDIEEDMEANV